MTNKPIVATDLVNSSTWNKRYLLMQDMVHQGPEARAIVIEAINILKETKDLSFGERKMLDLAQNYDKIMAERNAKIIELFKKVSPNSDQTR